MMTNALDLLLKPLPSSRILALVPEDPFIHQLIRKHLVEKTFPKAQDSLLNLEDRNGADTTLPELRSLLSESPLFGGQRMVWIEQGDKIEDLSEKELSPLLKIPSPKALLILEVKEKTGQELASLIPVFKMGWSRTPAQKDQELAHWILEIGKRRGLSVTPDAADVLNHYFEGHLGLIDQWLEQTNASSNNLPGQKPPVINRDFLLQSEDPITDPLQSVFQLFSGWEEKDDRILRDWRRFAGKNGSPLGILSLWHRQWRLYALGSSLANLPDGAETLARTEKLSGYRVKKVMETSKKLSRAAILKGYSLLTETDLLLKSGANADVVMDRFHLEMWALSPKGQKPTNRTAIRKVR